MLLFGEPLKTLYYAKMQPVGGEGYISMSYGYTPDSGVIFVNTTTGKIYLDTNITDNAPVLNIPQILQTLLGISNAWHGIVINNTYGESSGEIVQPGQLDSINQSFPAGTPWEYGSLDGSIFDITLSPTTTLALVADAATVAVAVVGVFQTLNSLSSSLPASYKDIIVNTIISGFAESAGLSLITSGIDTSFSTSDFNDLMDQLGSASLSVLGSSVSFLFNSLPQILIQYAGVSLLKNFAKVFGEDVAEDTAVFASELGSVVMAAIPISELIADLIAVFDTVLSGNYYQKYEISSLTQEDTYSVNGQDGPAISPYVTVTTPNGSYGWNGQWFGSAGFVHSSYTDDFYTLATPDPSSAQLVVTVPSGYSSIPYDITITSHNITTSIVGEATSSSPVVYNITYTNSTILVQKEYTVEFKESGLPAGSSWSVTLNGSTSTSSTNTISFTDPNGTYNYSVTEVSGFKTDVYSATVTVSGSSLNVSVIWSPVTYPITITETGIPTGTSWSATLTGITFTGEHINITLNSTTSTITFNEPNGTYNYAIHLPSGYHSTNMTGAINVVGAPASASITAHTVTNYLLIGVVAAIIVVIAAIVAAVLIVRGRKKQEKK